MCKIDRKSEKVGRQMCTLTCFFLPFHGAFLDGLFARELIVSDLHTLDRLCGCPVPRVCVALRQGSVGGVGCSVCRMIPRMVKTKEKQVRFAR